jgi:hypothetical protein
MPGEDPPDDFVYDPADPVPTRGGNTLILAMGVQDQRPVETRDDGVGSRRLRRLSECRVERLGSLLVNQ